MRKKLVLLLLIMAVAVPAAAVQSSPAKLTLEESIVAGMKNSPMTKLNDLNLYKARCAVQKAASALWPSASLMGNATKMYDMYSDPFDYTFMMALLNKINYNTSDPVWPDEMAPMDLTYYTAKVNVNQILFSPPVFKSYQIAKLYYGQERFKWEKSRQDLILNVVNAYLSALKAKHFYELAQENVNQAGRYLFMTKVRFDVGLVTKADVLRMEVALATAKNNLSKADIGFKISLLGLKNLLGLPLDQEIELVEVEPPAFYELASPQEMLAEALEKRGDYLSGKIIVELAKIGVSLAKGNYWPNLMASASYGQSGVNELDFDNNKWTLSLSLNWNLWDGGKTQAELGDARASLKQARINLDMTAKNIGMELTQIYLNNNEVQQRLALNQKAVEQAAESLRLAEKSYEAGLITTMALDDARLALETARLNHLQAKFDAVIYDYNMRKARGILDTTAFDRAG
ncbi:MAG: TolC family protein [Bacillota bacterium]